MQNHPADDPVHEERFPFRAAAELQDDLLSATNDLDRLQTLLGDAYASLQHSFMGVWQDLDGVATAPQPAALASARKHLRSAVTALQFQDMASQLVEHLRRRLRHCADRLACDAMADDEDGVGAVAEAPLRPNPVTQAEMDTGFIELF
ncbi:MAG: hypothetical protein WA210_09815 [Burkholderiaceae bacterium]